MKRTSLALVLLAVTAVACSERPRISGKAHASPSPALVGQAIGSTTDPHVVQRDVTPSSYCVACHAGYDTNGHPVGVSLAAAAAANPVWYTFPPVSPAIVMVNGEYVECSSCHDDGSAGFPYRTVLPGMCGACHSEGDSASPTVTITTPSDGATVQGTISVQGTATDDTSVEWSELWAGPADSPMTRVASGYSYGGNVTFSLPFDTTTMADGAASLRVRVYDYAGRTTDVTIAVTISNPIVPPPPPPPPPDTTSPSVSMTGPADGSVVRGTITLQATATDDVGVDRVELWIVSPGTAETLAGSVAGSSATFAVDTTALADGTLWCVVRAYDAAGNVGNATAFVVVDNTPPAVAITSPAPDSVVRSTTTIEATATDASAVAVDFYVDGVFLSRSTSAPYTTTWEPVRRSGAHALTAVATDAAGNVTTSAAVTVRVK